MTQENLALAHQALADHDTCADPAPELRTALAHVEAALEVYDAEHMPCNHRKATVLRDRLRARLGAPGSGPPARRAAAGDGPAGRPRRVAAALPVHDSSRHPA